MPVSKNEQKLIRSLAYGKYRHRHRLFVAEGQKVIETIAARYRPVKVYSTLQHDNSLSPLLTPLSSFITPSELQRISFLQHPQDMLALFPLPEDTLPMVEELSLCLALDGIQDPGNLGTIVRLADWFGMQHIFCSHDTADVFSPKTIQATMGSIAHVSVHYVDLPAWLASMPDDLPAYATTLDGDSLYEARLSDRAVIIMGNEGKGITEEVRRQVKHNIKIPSYQINEQGAESLNVATATAIICAEWRRKCFGPKQELP